MEQLIFSSAISQSGFTNASTSASNDKDSSTIIREILQNSYDSAINEANRDTAKVKFIIDYIDKNQIPGILEYEQALEAIKKEDLSKKEQEQDILNVIEEQLKSEKIPILYIVDNGIGFNQKKLVAILSDGISDKDNPNDSGGSYGNGHFSAFNISDLRYVLYGGKFEDNSKLCSGQALLRTHKQNGNLKLGTGFLLTKESSIEVENDIFYKNENIPNIIDNQLNLIEESGAVVGIVGFNFFNNEKDIEKVTNLISSSIIRNFYVAIHENDLEVEIITQDNTININNETLNDIFKKTQNEKSSPNYNTAKRFYDMLNYGKKQTITTKEGEVKIYYQLSNNDTKLALCRNGMWIDKSIPSPLNKGNFPSNKAFNALILAQKRTNFSTLIRRAEGNLHNNIRLNRFSNDKGGKDKREKLSISLKEIKEFLSNIIEKNDNDSFDYDIPDLSISMVGDTKSKQQNKRKSTQTKKIPKRKKIVIDSDIPPSEKGKGKKNKSNTKLRVGNQFEVGKFSSFHNTKKQEAKLRFATDKNASNLLLCLRLEDGTDPTCDSVGITPRLKIKKALNNDIECKIIHDDTIDIGKVDKNTLINLNIEYDTNIKGDYIIDYEFLNSASKDKK